MPGIPLVDVFHSAQKLAITVGDLQVFASLRASVCRQDLVRIRRLSSNSQSQQCFLAGVLKGKLECEGTQARRMVLWYGGSYPDEATLRCLVPRAGGLLAVYNGWREASSEFASSGLGNAGMLLEHRETETIIRCNEARNPQLTFDNLIVSVSKSSDEGITWEPLISVDA